jgi:hypothetical protein
MTHLEDPFVVKLNQLTLSAFLIAASTLSWGQDKWPATHLDQQTPFVPNVLQSSDAQLNEIQYQSTPLLRMHLREIDLHHDELGMIASALANDGTVVGHAFGGEQESTGLVVRWSADGSRVILGGAPSYSLLNRLPLISRGNGRIVNNHVDWSAEHAMAIPQWWDDFFGWQVLSGLVVDSSMVTFISDNGSSLAGYGGNADGQIGMELAFVWTQTDGQVILPTPEPFERAEAWAVSNDGSIVAGGALTREEDSYGWPYDVVQGGFWMNETWHALNDANGMPVGSAFACNSTCSFMVGGGAVGNDPMQEQGLAWIATPSGPAIHMSTASLTPGHHGPYYAIAVSEDGRRAVGTYYRYQEHDLGTIRIQQPFLWLAESGMHSLFSMLADEGIEFGGQDWPMVATGISSDGSLILLNGLDADNVRRAAVVELVDGDVIFRSRFSQ